MQAMVALFRKKCVESKHKISSLWRCYGCNHLCDCTRLRIHAFTPEVQGCIICNDILLQRRLAGKYIYDQLSPQLRYSNCHLPPHSVYPHLSRSGHLFEQQRTITTLRVNLSVSSIYRSGTFLQYSYFTTSYKFQLCRSIERHPKEYSAAYVFINSFELLEHEADLFTDNMLIAAQCTNCGHGIGLRGVQTPPSPIPQLLNTNHTPSLAQCHPVKATITDKLPNISRLEAEIDRLQAIIEDLKRECGSLREYSHAHDILLSPIRKLPPEILAEIFRNALPDRRNNAMLPYKTGEMLAHRRAAMLLGQICRFWRAVAVATPQLWSSIGTEIHYSRHDPRTIELDVEMTKTFSRSVGCMSARCSPFGKGSAFRASRLPDNPTYTTLGASRFRLYHHPHWKITHNSRPDANAKDSSYKGSAPKHSPNSYRNAPRCSPTAYSTFDGIFLSRNASSSMEPVD